MIRHRLLPLFLLYLGCLSAQSGLEINDAGYFHMPGLSVTVFSDIYPEGHQTGVSVIQHGRRVAANGDLRLEPSPGQWSPVPKGGPLTVDEAAGQITQTLWYPDTARNRRGFNPILYPDLRLKYDVQVEALEGSAFRIAVHLKEPLPEDWAGRTGFQLELFPGHFFGKAYLMDGQVGRFPNQPNGPIEEVYGEWLARPLASGRRLIVAPEDSLLRMQILSETEPMQLLDGRANHNNGWFIVRSPVPAGATDNAVVWTVQPYVDPAWRYEPVIQVSKLGYAPDHPKRVVIEQDARDRAADPVRLYRLTPSGRQLVEEGLPRAWGGFLRYHYLVYDFSELTDPGMYVVGYRDHYSQAFEIGSGVFRRHVWQPGLEYFLPVQMCHVRVNEKYRVWHDYCHLDDALMAPVDTNHFDGYLQGPSTLTDYAPLEPVPQLNRGGWHDAGDYDLRVESQIGTVWKLALMVEEFGLDYDATRIDPEARLVEIHQPDGRSDAIQQIEHGLATVLGGYLALGRLYRGIICNDLRQYVMLGDASSMTDNIPYQGPSLNGPAQALYSGQPDDRWVFTEDNPERALQVAAGLAAAARALRGENDPLAEEALSTALALWNANRSRTERISPRVVALSELILATGADSLGQALVGMQAEILEDFDRHAWAIGHVIEEIADVDFRAAMTEAARQYVARLQEEAETQSPYGVPYEPYIWGAGWGIQSFGVDQYFVAKGWPEFAAPELYLNALQFVLGVHPGENTSSFASGVGSESVLVAYGVNRADWSHIPGGVASGTALIRPDLPEMKVWPFFWQQTEYVMGGGATNFMFLAMAAERF